MESSSIKRSRIAGVAVPLSALRSEPDSGIGEIFDLVPFLDWSVAAGQRLIALLPLGDLAPGESSPYNALSSFALDPLFLTLGEIPELAGVAGAEPPSAAAGARVDRERVREWKEPFFLEAFDRFRRLPGDCARRRAHERFCRDNADWLEDYALFRALGEEQGWISWRDWPRSLQRRQERALAAAAKRLGERIGLLRYLQFAAEEQWWRIRERARSAGVLLMGDLPFAPSVNSADVWGNQEIFDPARTVGAPPDDFSASGQRWGLPMFRWERMRAKNWPWFRSRFRRLADLYDLYRIDHVVGLFRTFAFRGEGPGRFDPGRVPAQTAQGREILGIAIAESGKGSVVAEDLGMIPDFVRECMHDLDVPGYKVFRWERTDGGFLDPREYPECSIATTGTHDTDTLAAWWKTLTEAERGELLSLLGDSAGEGETSAASFESDVHERVLRRLYESPSRFVILPIQDLFGWEERINLPATVGPENWSYRLPVPVARLVSDPRFSEETARIGALVRETARS